jgi:hypothetical protein
MGYNVCKLEPKSKSHQFAGFLDGLPTYRMVYNFLLFPPLCGSRLLDSRRQGEVKASKSLV